MQQWLCEGDGGREGRRHKEAESIGLYSQANADGCISHPSSGYHIKLTWKGPIWKAGKYNQIFITWFTVVFLFIYIFFIYIYFFSCCCSDPPFILIIPLSSLIYACKCSSPALPPFSISILNQFVFVSKTAFSVLSTTLSIHLPRMLSKKRQTHLPHSAANKLAWKTIKCCDAPQGYAFHLVLAQYVLMCFLCENFQRFLQNQHIRLWCFGRNGNFCWRYQNKSFASCITEQIWTVSLQALKYLFIKAVLGRLLGPVHKLIMQSHQQRCCLTVEKLALEIQWYPTGNIHL